jgi:aspartate racemase
VVLSGRKLRIGGREPQRFVENSQVHIGLIGGIGPAATDFYYRRLISTFASRKAALELTIVHADTPTLLGNLARKDTDSQVAIYMKLTNRLAAAGAECVAVTSIAGHFCIDAFKVSSVLPVVDMITAVDRALEHQAFARIGILGTRTVMETRFYGAISRVEVVPPSGQDLEDVHQAYVAMAASGVVTEAQSAVFHAVSKKLLSESGVEAIMLGGTDLALVFDERNAEFPLVDCAGIHADAIAKLAEMPEPGS